MSSNLRQMLLIYLILLLWSILSSASVNGPVMPLYVKFLGIGVISWSLLAASAAFGMFLFEWIWGAISDRVDRRTLMLSCILAMSVLFPLYTFKFFVPYFIVLQFLWGAIGCAMGPTTRGYMSESPQRSVGLFASLWWSFSILGGIIGPLIGTYLAESWSFSYPFYASSVLALVSACLVILAFPKPKRCRSQQEFQGLRSTLHMRSAWFLFLSAVFAFMTFSLMKSFLPLYAAEQMGMSTVQVGILLSVSYAAQLVAMPLMGWLSDKFGRRRMAGIGFATSSFIFLFYLVSRTQFQLFLTSVIVSLGLSATSLLLAVIPEITPNTLYGTAIGMYGSFEDLGLIIGPLIFGFVWSTFSPVVIFVVGSLTQLLSALLVLAIKPRQIDSQIIGAHTQRGHTRNRFGSCKTLSFNSVILFDASESQELNRRNI